jgi:hypothetical protein
MFLGGRGADADGQRCVANLLLRGNSREDLPGLGGVLERIDHFLAAASTAPPPVDLEAEMRTGRAGDDDGTQLVLNVVGGVLEEKRAVELQRTRDGVVLPTAENEQKLRDASMGESVALLNLMAALSGRTPTAAAGGGGGWPILRKKKQARRAAVSRGDDSDDPDGDGEAASSSSTSSSSGCVVMDASTDSGDEEDGGGDKSGEEKEATTTTQERRRLVTEMN